MRRAIAMIATGRAPVRRSQGRSGGGRDRRPLVAAAAVALVGVLLASAVAPAPADAKSIVSKVTGAIGGGISSVFGAVTGTVTGGIAQLAVSAFKAIIQALFAPIARFISDQLLAWLVAIPNLTQGRVGSLELTVAALAGGLLLAVATFSIIRFWLVGLVGSGGDAGLEGLMRTVAAAFFIGLWPTVFDKAVWLTNLGTSALLGSGTVIHNMSHLLAAGLGANLVSSLAGGPLGLFIMIVVAVAASLLFLALLLLKIVLAISTVLVFVGMPLAVVAWPVVPWVARLAMRAFAVCLVVPVLWALCFATASAVGLNAATFNASGVADTLLQPLVAIVLLYVMLRLPTHLARVAMLGAAPLGGGFVSRTVSYAAGSQLRHTAGQYLPSSLGGREQAPERESTTGGRLREAATLAGAAATGGATAGATAAAGATGAGTSATAGAPGARAGATSAGTGSSASAGSSKATTAGASGSRVYTPPATAQARASGQDLHTGLQTPSFAGREEDFRNEMFEAKHRERANPVSVGEGRAALASLPEATRRGVGQLVSEHGPGAREHLAYQAMGEWTPQEREALRTLAAATPEVRSQAVEETRQDDSVAGEPETTASGTGPGTVSDEPGASGPGPGQMGSADAATGGRPGEPGGMWLGGEIGKDPEPPGSQPPESAPPIASPDRSSGVSGSSRPGVEGSPPPEGSPSPEVPPREPRDPSPRSAEPDTG